MFHVKHFFLSLSFLFEKNTGPASLRENFSRKNASPLAEIFEKISTVSTNACQKVRIFPFDMALLLLAAFFLDNFANLPHHVP